MDVRAFGGDVRSRRPALRPPTAEHLQGTVQGLYSMPIMRTGGKRVDRNRNQHLLKATRQISRLQKWEGCLEEEYVGRISPLVHLAWHLNRV